MVWKERQRMKDEMKGNVTFKKREIECVCRITDYGRE